MFCKINYIQVKKQVLYARRFILSVGNFTTPSNIVPRNLNNNIISNNHPYVAENVETVYFRPQTHHNYTPSDASRKMSCFIQPQGIIRVKAASSFLCETGLMTPYNSVFLHI